MSISVETFEQMSHETRAYALAAQLLSDADVTQIILLHPRRPDDRLGTQTSHHDAPCADWPVESQDQERTGNREAQDGATIEAGARGNHPTADLGDTMSLPAKFAAALEEREAQEFLMNPQDCRYRTRNRKLMDRNCRSAVPHQRHPRAQQHGKSGPSNGRRSFLSCDLVGTRISRNLSLTLVSDEWTHPLCGW